jgi:hypothetical protein
VVIAFVDAHRKEVLIDDPRRFDGVTAMGAGRELMDKLIDSVSDGVPAALIEVTKLGRTLKQPAAHVLAYFDRPGTATAPPKRLTGASNTSAAPPSGSRNLTNYIARRLLSVSSNPTASDPNSYTLDWMRLQWGHEELLEPQGPALPPTALGWSWACREPRRFARDQ